MFVGVQTQFEFEFEQNSANKIYRNCTIELAVDSTKLNES